MKLFSFEVISHQYGDEFPEKLEALVTEIYEKIGDESLKTQTALFKSTIPKRLEGLIKERFNMNVKLDSELHRFLPAAIIPFSGDYLSSASQPNQFIAEHFNELFGATNIFKHIKGIDKERAEYYRRIHNRTGFLDRKNVRVGGYLADVKHYLIINFFELKEYGLTPREVVAVISHELGHAFTGLANHFRLMTNNTAIMEVLNEINGNRKERAIYVFKRHFGEDAFLKSDLDKDGPITDFYPELARQYLGTLESQMINGKYDETNFENMADSFATRFGLGKDLISGLHKIHVSYGHVVNSQLEYTTLWFIEALSIALTFVLTGPFGVAFFVAVVLFMAGKSNANMTYDVPVDRYYRIRNNIIDGLKNRDLPKVYAADLLSQLSYIDQVIDQTRHRPAIADLIADFILPSNRAVSYYINAQQTIEHSLNNNLYVKTAQLSQL